MQALGDRGSDPSVSDRLERQHERARIGRTTLDCRDELVGQEIGVIGAVGEYSGCEQLRVDRIVVVGYTCDGSQ